MEQRVHDYCIGIAQKLIAREKLSIEEIAYYVGLPIEEIRELKEEKVRCVWIAIAVWEFEVLMM